jgi:hypothetical protein
LEGQGIPSGDRNRRVPFPSDDRRQINRTGTLSMNIDSVPRPHSDRAN